MKKLDSQLKHFENRLRNDVKVEEKHITSICSTIYQELSQLPYDDLVKIRNSSPVNLEIRIEELKAFNMMMNRMTKTELKRFPEMVRAQVIVQNYISFVYLKDNCFEVTKKVIPTGTLTKRICKFLLNNPVRAFRNSIAHGNWQYSDDFSGLKYFAHKGEIKEEAEVQEMSEFFVSNEELGFWQGLSRATAYAIYTYIVDNDETIITAEYVS